jgi:hypothetical protein
VQALEFAPLPPDRIAAIASRLESDFEVFFECACRPGVEAAVAAIARHGAMAKVRTGGISPGAFPAPPDLVDFMAACAAAGVAFKATAGLHHALSGQYALTYQPDSPASAMFGFLNVCVAAAVVHAGGPREEALEALGATSASALSFTDSEMRWRGWRFHDEALRSLRVRLFKSFGSCAFGEPVGELERLGLV